MAVFRLVAVYVLMVALPLLLSSCYESPYSSDVGDGAYEKTSIAETKTGIGTGAMVEHQEDPRKNEVVNKGPSDGGADGTTETTAGVGGTIDSADTSTKSGGSSRADGKNGVNKSNNAKDSDNAKSSNNSKGSNNPKGSNNSKDSGSAAGSQNGRRYPASVKRAHFHPGYYMAVGSRDSILAFNDIADNPDFVGVKKRYTWRDLEPEKGRYDFSEIAADLEYLQSIGKYLWISISITMFSSEDSPLVPRYMWNDSRYGCGFGGEYYGSYKRELQKGGWLPCRGNREFDKRFEALYTALGERFNNEPYFEGLNLSETSTGKRPDNLSMDDELRAFKGYALAAKKAFPNKTVMQMINYARFDLYEFSNWLVSKGIATGGPDVHIGRVDGTLKAAYSIHKKNHWKTPNGIDVQWDNWEKGGKQYSTRDLIDAAVEYINPWYIFWVRKPGVFEEDIVPAVREYGQLPSVKRYRGSR